MDRLGEIRVRTLVIAGARRLPLPTRASGSARGGIPNARLRIIERAGHNPHAERTDEVMEAVTDFLTADVAEPAGEVVTGSFGGG